MSLLDLLKPKRPTAAANVRWRTRRKSIARQLSTATGPEREALEAECALGEAEDRVRSSKAVDAFRIASPVSTAAVKTASRSAVAAATGTLETIKARVAALLGLTAAPATSPTPADPAPAPSPVTASSGPLAVASAVLGLLKIDKEAFTSGRGDPKRVAAAVAQLQKLQGFIAAVSRVDPQARHLDRIETGSRREQEEAAKVLGGIIGNLSPSAPSAAVTPSAPSANQLHGLDRVRAAFARKPAATAPKPPARPADSLSAKLTGLDRNIAAEREKSGLPPLPLHVALAAKNTATPSK